MTKSTEKLINEMESTGLYIFDEEFKRGLTTFYQFTCWPEYDNIEYFTKKEMKKILKEHYKLIDKDLKARGIIK